MTELPNCYTLGTFPIQFLQLFPLEIPASANYVGDIMTDEGLAQRWDWYSPQYYGFSVVLELWVLYSNNAVKRFVVPFFVTDFSKIKVGPIDPSIYAKPKVKCMAAPRVQLPFEQQPVTVVDYIKSVIDLQKKNKLYSAPAQIENPQRAIAEMVQSRNIKGNVPPVPSIPSTYTTVWKFYSHDQYNKTFVLSTGTFGVDSKSGGVKFYMGAPRAPLLTPYIVRISFLGSPVGNVVAAYIYANEICWAAGPVVGTNWAQAYPIRIPVDSTFGGNFTINGQKCSSWIFQDTITYGNAIFEFFVNYRTSYVDRIAVNGTTWLPYFGGTGSGYFDFSDTVTTIPSGYFDAPKIECNAFKKKREETSSFLDMFL